jgi:hypothetical protein
MVKNCDFCGEALPNDWVVAQVRVKHQAIPSKVAYKLSIPGESDVLSVFHQECFDTIGEELEGSF